MVGVAQLVEPRIVIPVVVGSSPIARPKFFGEGQDGVVQFARFAEKIWAVCAN